MKSNVGVKRLGLPFLPRMHPNVRRDLVRLCQLDHVRGSCVAAFIKPDRIGPAINLNTAKKLGIDIPRRCSGAPPPIILWTAYGRNLTTQCLRSAAGSTETWHRGVRLPWPTVGHRGLR